MKFIKNLHAFFLFVLLSLHVHAQTQIQILHTNDLHGFQENTVSNPQRGGFAALKTLTELEKEKAQALGIKTIILDGGDFMEGSIFYMANRGRANFEMMDLLGYDYVVLGNHDWLMGEEELGAILRESSFKFNLLGANLKHKEKIKSGTKEIKNYSIIEVDGFKIAIMGLTTDERYYRWRFGQVDIKSPIKRGAKLAKELKEKKGVDFVIALTHLGVTADLELGRASKHIDLVVGGHSHTSLYQPVYAKRKDGVKIPIVQAGEHGNYLGKLIINLEDKKLSVAQYELIPIKKENEDKKILEAVAKNRQFIEHIYGKEKLEEKVGLSEIELVNSEYRPTAWNAILADSMKEAVNADFAVHSAGFSGTDLPAGPITKEQLFQNYPRVFGIDEKEGWHIYKVKVYGVVVEFLLRTFLSGERGMTLSGISFELKNGSGKIVDIKNIKIGGRPLKRFERYTVALPEGVVKGGLGISSLVRYLLQAIGKTEVSMWEAMARKMKKIGVITKEEEINLLETTTNLNSDEPNIEGDQKSRSEFNYTFIPRKKAL